MSFLVIGQDDKIAAWCAAQIPHVGAAGFGLSKAIGVAIEHPSGPRLIAACVYHNWIEAYGICEISFAALSPRWATKPNIRALLAVPFAQYKARKVYLQIPADNARALRVSAGIGFKREAVLRHHYAAGRHGVVMSMMRDEWAQTWRVGRARPEWRARAEQKEAA